MRTFFELFIMLLGTTLLGFMAGYYIARIKLSLKTDSFIKMRKKRI